MDELGKEVIKILSNRAPSGNLRSRESNKVEFKKAFNMGCAAVYAKTMAAFANNSGGFIIFGVDDSPRCILWLKNDNFENLKQENMTEIINSNFAPAIDWEIGTVEIDVEENKGGIVATVQKKIGWIYTYESELKPVIAQKDHDKEHITAGDIFYRYRARNGKIKPSEMEMIISERVKRERDNLLRVLEAIRKSKTANLGIVNYSNGRFSTPYGVDVAFDRKLVAQVLKKAKYIKEGSFSEIDGVPVIKVTGNIDLAEEVPVPEGNPDDTHPYIQKQMAELLDIPPTDLYALIWRFKMKEDKKFHLEITVANRKKDKKSIKTHKFSKYALEFLKNKLKELENNPGEFDKIRKEFKDMKKEERKKNG